MVSFVGEFDGGDTFGIVEGFFHGISFYFLAVFFPIIVNLISEHFDRIFCCFLLGFLLLFLLFPLLFFVLLPLLFCFLLFSQEMHILLEVPKGISCSFGVFFIVVDVVVELDEFDVLLEGPSAKAVGVEVELIALEV